MSIINNIYNHRFATIGVGFLVIFLIAKIAVILPERAIRDDFAHYYIASQFFLSGKNPYAENLAPLYQEYGFVNEGKAKTVITPNPPTFFFLFTPIAMLDPNDAFKVWLFIEIICLIIILWLTKWLLREDLSNRGWLLLFTAIIGSQWVYGHFFYSQVGLLLAGLILSAFFLNHIGKYTSACILIVLAGLIKIFPFVLLPWFALREKDNYEFRAGRLIIISALIFILLLITGIRNWIDYYKYTIPLLLDGSFGIGYNYSFPSYVVNLIYAAYDFKPPYEIARIWPQIGAASGLIILIICYLLCFLYLKNREIEFCSIILAMLISSVRTLGHYFVFLIFPIAIAFVRTSDVRSKKSFLILIIIYSALNLHGLNTVSFFNINNFFFVFFNYMPLYGLFALLIFFYKVTLPSPK